MGVIAQILMSLLDLVGIALVGLVASLTVTGINSNTPLGPVENVLKILNIGQLTFQSQTAILATLAIVVFLSRTFLSFTLNKKLFRFLGRCGAEISSNLFSKIVSLPLNQIGKQSVQQYVFSITSGVETLTLRLMGASMTLISDSALLIFVLLALAFVDLPMTLMAMLVVGAMFWILYRETTVKSRLLGVSYSNLDVLSRETLVDALGAYREIASKGRFGYFEREFRKSRFQVSRSLAEYNFMPYVGKYVIESSVMIAAFLVAGAQFLLTDALNALTTLSIFMAAGSRLAPAVLRIQQGVVGLNNSLGIAEKTLDLINEVNASKKEISNLRKFTNIHDGFAPIVELKNVSFRFPLSNTETLTNINLVINAGESIAIVGPSGAGKTTLIDLMMGFLTPENGSISISGHSPRSAISIWPGALGYVPQNIYISSGTVAHNVALGFVPEEVQEVNIWEALKKAQCYEFISSLSKGLSTELGERGMNLSGGQKQRLGIARALLTRPKILFLDEATSALDGQTEYEVTKSLESLRGEITLICIAHRLSTAKRADRVIYIESGKIIADGNFDEVRVAVPDFQKQAELMDLGL